MKHTPGPWQLCRHLQNIEADKACSCGYRGGIYGSDGNGMVCEIGSTLVPGEAGLEAPRYCREIEIANAHLIAAAPEILEALENLIIGIGMGWDLEGLIALSKVALKKAGSAIWA